MYFELNYNNWVLKGKKTINLLIIYTIQNPLQIRYVKGVSVSRNAIKLKQVFTCRGSRAARVARVEQIV